MPERPDDPPQRAHKLTDRERAEAARLREIARKAPPLPAVNAPFPAEPPWSAGIADIAHLWLRVECECGAHTGLPLRYLAAVLGWKTPLSDVVPRLRCKKCRGRPSSVELVEDATLDAPGVPRRGKRNRLQLV